MSEAAVMAVVACDLERSPIGTASRLLRHFCGETVLRRTVQRLGAVRGVGKTVLMAPPEQMEPVRDAVAGMEVEVVELMRRPEEVERRVRTGRAWNLYGWRGGAGQWTVFDEDYHPRGAWRAVQQARGERGHVLVVAAHAGLLDVELTSALVTHHLRRRDWNEPTYTPAAPGLSGMVLAADFVKILAEAGTEASGGILPGQVMAYNPRAPGFDSLTREACMQVDPAVSKLANRFLLDTERAWGWAERAYAGPEAGSAAELARRCQMIRGQPGSGTVSGAPAPLAVAPGQPREVEIEVTARRLTAPAGSVPEHVRMARGDLDAERWTRWLQRQKLADDVVVSIGGDGDPLLYEGWVAVARAARRAGALSVHVQTDLLEGVETLVAAVNEGAVDVVGVTFYGDDEETYRAVGGMKAGDGYATVMQHMAILRKTCAGRGVVIVPRLLKVRETVAQMEAFFDRWVDALGWAVIDSPTDRAGQIAASDVVSMAPPKRKACRRIEAGLGRVIIRSDGAAVACDQDMHGTMVLGYVETDSLEAMWTGPAATALRAAHAEGTYGRCRVCEKCREWHRA